MGRFMIRKLAGSPLSGVMLTGLAGTGAALADAGINILMNQAKILKLSRPADTIIIGNPQIADASVQDSSTIILTGRGSASPIWWSSTPTACRSSTNRCRLASTANSVRVYRRATCRHCPALPIARAFRTEAEQASDRDEPEQLIARRTATRASIPRRSTAFLPMVDEAS
jgi:hypothetical protein